MNDAAEVRWRRAGVMSPVPHVPSPEETEQYEPMEGPLTADERLCLRTAAALLGKRVRPEVADAQARWWARWRAYSAKDNADGPYTYTWRLKNAPTGTGV